MLKNGNYLHELGFTKGYLNRIAFETGFIKRVRKLDGLDYLSVLLSSVAKQVVSYNVMASTLASNFSKTVFKQSLHKAMRKEAFDSFICRIFNEILQAKLSVANNGLKWRFKRVIIQDSTIVKLPSQLFQYFSGVKNQVSQVANARLQLALDIKSNLFTLFSIDSYSVNDLLAASSLSTRKGDLVIRDRGYCSLSEINRMIQAQCDFIYRYYHGFKYYDVRSRKVIDVYKLLKGKKQIKLKVRVGSPDGPHLTLVAEKVPNQLAENRRRQLKKNAHYPPSKALLRLASWSILITSIKHDEVKYGEIYNLYALRWRIEIIFKAMKSHPNFNKIHNIPVQQLRFIFLGKMILLLLMTQVIYPRLLKIVHRLSGKFISLLKLISYLKDNMMITAKLLKSISDRKIDPDIVNYIKYYCTYERRKDRDNFEESLHTILLS